MLNCFNSVFASSDHKNYSIHFRTSFDGARGHRGKVRPGLVLHVAGGGPHGDERQDEIEAEVNRCSLDKFLTRVISFWMLEKNFWEWLLGLILSISIRNE